MHDYLSVTNAINSMLSACVCHVIVILMIKHPTCHSFVHYESGNVDNMLIKFVIIGGGEYINVNSNKINA